jgi:hypothetical protein
MIKISPKGGVASVPRRTVGGPAGLSRRRNIGLAGLGAVPKLIDRDLAEKRAAR